MISDNEIQVGPLFVEKLRDAGKINEATFSFALNGFNNENSYIDFGEPVV